VRRANERPFNHRQGASNPYGLHFRGNVADIVIGTNRFVGWYEEEDTTVVGLSVDDDPFVSFRLSDGHLLLSVAAYDRANRCVLSIENNQLCYSTLPWDIEFKGRALTIREAAREILIEMRFEPPNRVIVSRGRFLRNGVEVIIHPTRGILVVNNKVKIDDVHIYRLGKRCQTAISIGAPSRPDLKGAIRVPDVPRQIDDYREAVLWEWDSFDSILQSEDWRLKKGVWSRSAL
jgi:hypothetical protein